MKNAILLSTLLFSIAASEAYLGRVDGNNMLRAKDAAIRCVAETLPTEGLFELSAEDLTQYYKYDFIKVSLITGEEKYVAILTDHTFAEYIRGVNENQIKCRIYNSEKELYKAIELKTLPLACEE